MEVGLNVGVGLDTRGVWGSDTSNVSPASHYLIGREHMPESSLECYRM